MLKKERPDRNPASCKIQYPMKNRIMIKQRCSKVEAVLIKGYSILKFLKMMSLLFPLCK